MTTKYCVSLKQSIKILVNLSMPNAKKKQNTPFAHKIPLTALGKEMTNVELLGDIWIAFLSYLDYKIILIYFASFNDKYFVTPSCFSSTISFSYFSLFNDMFIFCESQYVLTTSGSLVPLFHFIGKHIPRTSIEHSPFYTCIVDADSIWWKVVRHCDRYIC